MDKMFDSPWVLRVTALLLAFLLFLYVQAGNESNVDTTSSEQADIIKDVPVKVYYDDDNFVVTGLPETVNMTIKGPFQIVLRTKALKNFTVFVDLRDLTMGEHQVPLQYENISDKLEVTLDPATINVVVEEKVTKEFRVDPEMNSNLIEDGYVLTGMFADPATVFVTGAKSAIDRISYVKATVQEDAGLNASFEQDANVRVLDRDLDRLDVVISPEKVNVKVGIEPYSKELPLVLNQVGSPPEGVTIDTLALLVNTVKVTGSKSKIDKLQQITVDVDVSNIKESKNYEVELVLPEGVKYMTPQKVTVNAKVTVVEKATDNTTNTPVNPTTNTENIDS